MVSRGKKILDDFTVSAGVAGSTRRMQKALRATWSLLLLNYLCWDFKISSGSITVPSDCLLRQHVVHCSFPQLPVVFSQPPWIQVIQLANSPSLAYQLVTLACCLLTHRQTKSHSTKNNYDQLRWALYDNIWLSNHNYSYLLTICSQMDHFAGSWIGKSVMLSKLQQCRFLDIQPSCDQSAEL